MALHSLAMLKALLCRAPIFNMRVINVELFSILPVPIVPNCCHFTFCKRATTDMTNTVDCRKFRWIYALQPCWFSWETPVFHCPLQVFSGSHFFRIFPDLCQFFFYHKLFLAPFIKVSVLMLRLVPLKWRGDRIFTRISSYREEFTFLK